MATYCEQDVIVLRDVYKAMRPYVSNHPNLNHFTEDHVCPNCGSHNLQKKGYTYTRVAKKQRFICTDCGAQSQGKTAIGASREIR